MTRETTVTIGPKLGGVLGLAALLAVAPVTYDATAGFGPDAFAIPAALAKGGSGGDDSGSGNSGRNSGSDDSGQDSYGDDGGSRSGDDDSDDQGRSPAGGSTVGGWVVKIEVSAAGIEVRYSDGTKEEIENGRYERKNSAGRTVEERPATQADFDRLSALD